MLILKLFTILTILIFLSLASFALMNAKKYAHLSERALLVTLIFIVISVFVITGLIVTLFSLK